MAKRVRWIRNLSLDVQHFDQLGLGVVNEQFVRYIFIPEGESRTRSIRLTSNNVGIRNKNKKVVSYSLGKGNSKKGYLVNLHGLKHGHSKLIAKCKTTGKKRCFMFKLDAHVTCLFLFDQFAAMIGP